MDIITTESWKIIEGFEDYEVSCFGEVRRFTDSNSLRRYRKGMVLKPGIGSSGYYLVVLYLNGKRHTKSVHRLVASAFVLKRKSKEKLVVNHLNGIKTDNRAVNLEWCTSYENSKHAFENGFYRLVPPPIARGSAHPLSKLTESDVVEIKKLTKDGEISYSDIAKKFKTTKSNISSIKNGKTWRHVPCP